MNPIRVNIIVWKIVAGICATFFGVCFVGALLSHVYIPAALFAVFLFLAAVLLLSYGPVQVSEEEIAMVAPLGVYAIRWDEIERISFGSSHLVFQGAKSRLTVPVPLFWNGKDKKAVIEVLESFSKKSGIMPARSYGADYQLSKNSRKTA